MSTPEPLLSAQWFRVANLRPQLDRQARVERISYRREVWHVLVRADGSRSLRMRTPGWSFVGRANGQLSVQRLWELVLAEQREAAPTQDELIRLMHALHQAGLLTFDRRPDFGIAGVAPARAETEGKPRATLLAMRISLGQPDAWLDRALPWFRAAFSAPAAWAWVALVAWAVVAALLNATQLQALVSDRLAQPQVWLYGWLAYPVLKALHELGHALAVKRLGGSVPEWGVSLLMFTPVPYVDASASTGFARPSQRLQVSLAGIVVELFFAAVALAVVLSVQPGVLRDVALAVFVTAGLSTLAVNGNPLMRFDGYHALTDALQLPNLATRSVRHWQAVMQRRLLGVPPQRAPEPAAGERPWLWAYAPASLAWQFGVMLALVSWVGSLSFWLGLALLGYGTHLLLLRPALRAWAFVRGHALADAEQQRAQRRGLALAGGALAIAALVPLPAASVVQGVVWPGEQALVRTGADGFVEQILVANGEAVVAGQPMFVLGSPRLVAEQARLAAQWRALDNERYAALQRDPEQADGLARQAEQVRAELARADEKVAALTVRAGVGGRVVLARAEDLPGRHVEQGTLLAHIAAPGPGMVRVAIEQDAARLDKAAEELPVTLRLASAPDVEWSGRLQADGAAPSFRLPSAALGERSGGAIAVDPKDDDGTTALRDVLVADVHLSDTLRQQVGQRIGERAWVRIDRGHAPLAWQGAQALQQLVLRHFNPAQ